MADSFHWHRIQEVFNSVVERPPGERGAVLAEACGDDAELRAEVESLLACNEQTPADFMRPPEPPPGIRPPHVSDGPDPLIGQSIGSYQIKSVIATGGMGTVYEAEQDQPRRVVALKVMNRYVASRSALRRFQSESQILAYLRHPNIAQVYEAGMATIHVAQPPSAVPSAEEDPPAEGGRATSAVSRASEAPPAEGGWATTGWATAGWATSVPYFAMEYIPDAKTITQYAEESQLDTRDRLRLFAKVCDAVHHGHQKGIIHRDLKPANILVDSTGEPKVIDFGVARATDSDIAVTTLRTDVGQLIGTLQYMSPEQCDADPHEIDTRGDVYSLGVVLYELLTGELPYEATGSTIVQAAQIIKEHSPRSLSSINRKLRGDVETIVLKTLEKDREERYQSAADLAQDIRRFLNHEAIEARSPTAWIQFVRWVAGHPALATTAGCLAIAAMVVGATYLSVWLLYARPNRIVVSDDRREARLLSLNDNVLHRWLAVSPSQITSANLAEAPDQFGGGQFALVAFSKGAVTPFSGSVCAFDLESDLKEPRWRGYITDEDVLPELRVKRGFSGHQFDAQVLLVEDVFAEQEHPGPEIVVMHQHSVWSTCVIRIYDLGGSVLYEVWHEGGIRSCYWVKGTRQLVCEGRNGEEHWKNRGHPGVYDPHPQIVFAIRPRVNYIGNDFLPTERADGPPNPVWYKCVFPPEIIGARNARYEFVLMPPSKVRPEQALHFDLRLLGISDASVGWDIDELGEEIPKTRVVTDLYRRNQDLPDNDPNKLPDPNSFHLAPLPPIVSMPEGVSAASDADGDNP